MRNSPSTVYADSAGISVSSTSQAPATANRAAWKSVAPIIGLLCLGIAPLQAQIVVPPGFSVQAITTGANLDIQPGPGGAFGTYVYYIDEAATPNNIMRVDPAGGPPAFFASVPSAITLGFGFGGDLFAAEGAFGASGGDVWRIASDGSVTFFAAIPSFVEGIAFSSGGPYGTNLYVSEFGPDTIKAIDALGNSTLLTGPGTIGTTPTGLEFGPGGAFGSDLYVIDRSGTIYTVAPAGVSSLFAGIDFGPLISRAETLAFGSPASAFGEFLFVAEEGSPGRILQISPGGAISTFASGFPGFSTGGVTGLEFNSDKTTLFVTDDQTATIYAISAGPADIEVVIDIKPGSDPNAVNPRSNGKIPIAVLTTNTGAGEPVDFDATQIDALSVRFGPSEAEEAHGRAHVRDVDTDGDADIVLHFGTQDTGIECGDTEATLTGETFSGQSVTGTDAIDTVGC